MNTDLILTYIGSFLSFFCCAFCGPHLNIMIFAIAAGLCLFTLHASQFSTCLLDNYVSLFEVLSKWCNHTNIELKRGAHSALESFLKQVLKFNLYLRILFPCKILNSNPVHTHLKNKYKLIY